MARLNFIKGALIGRTGEFVGSSWKGINYIKTYTKPTNPRTPAQQLTRWLFGWLGSMASSLAVPLLNGNMHPVPRRMSRMNRLVQHNKKAVNGNKIDLNKIDLFPVTSYPNMLIQLESVDDGEIINSHFKNEIHIKNLNVPPRRPSSIAVAIYIYPKKMWYSMGLIPVTGTADTMTIPFSTPDQILNAFDDAHWFICPVWQPNQELNLAGGNGETDRVFHGQNFVQAPTFT